ncbi:MAG: hypothetical protein NW207_04945 [Cytophagales bacterium]|nr:hypothetical protein [Cytophagales bacterium]
MSILILLMAGMQSKSQPKLFLNCPQDCFEDYVKQELSYFDFVRDRYLADMQILINTQTSANGGKRFNIRLLKAGSILTDSTQYISRAADTDAMLREIIVKKLKLLLIKQLPNPLLESMEIKFPKRTGDSLSNLKDPWHYWVLAPEVNGNAEGESNFVWRRIGAKMIIRKITHKHKFILYTEANNRYVSYTLDSNKTLQGQVSDMYIKPLYSYSLNEHFSLGCLARLENEQYRNIKYHLSAAPLLEYNFYPYRQNVSRQLRFVNQAGVWYNQYYYETIYSYTMEYRPYYRTSLIADINQPWGSVQAGLHFNTFVDNPRLYRIFLNINTSLRLVQGFSIKLEGQVSYIQDQISLVKKSFSDEAYLLYLQQLPTTFNYYSEFGLVYTFGSIYNTIVNPRFGQVY